MNNKVKRMSVEGWFEWIQKRFYHTLPDYVEETKFVKRLRNAVYESLEEEEGIIETMEKVIFVLTQVFCELPVFW